MSAYDEGGMSEQPSLLIWRHDERGDLHSLFQVEDRQYIRPHAHRTTGTLASMEAYVSPKDGLVHRLI